MRADRQEFDALVLFVLAGTCASILMFWVTAHGPGVTSYDSAVYIEGAKNLLSGNGFFAEGKPLTYYPPTYPLLLAVTSLFQHGDVLKASRWLGALLFGANIFLLGFAVWMCTERNLLAMGSAMLVFLSSSPIIFVHSVVLSEPLFITFTLAGLILLSIHLAHPRLYLLLASSLSIGLALTTRYVGVALLPSLAFALLLFGDQPIRYKIRNTVVAITVASLPLTCWFIRNVVIAESVTGRAFAIHPVSFHHVTALVNTIFNFAIPVSTSLWIKALYLGVAVALFLLALTLLHKKNYIRRNENSVRIALPVLCFVFAFTYIALLVISISFFDASTQLDARILLPALLALTVVGISLAWSLSRALDQRLIWYSFVFLVLLSISINSFRAIPLAVDIHDNGRGYTSRSWQNSEIIAYLTGVYDTRKIYSNGEDIIRFLAKKEAIRIPEKIFPITRSPNLNYEEQLGRISRECREGEALIAYLNGVTWRWYLPSIEELESKGNLPVLRSFEDGIVYARRPELKLN